MMQDFDKDFKRTSRIIGGLSICAMVLGLGILGFGIWVIVKVLQHFGII